MSDLTRLHVSDRFLQLELCSEWYVNEILDGRGCFQYLDRPVSESALTEIEIDSDYDPEHVLLNVVHPQSDN